MNEISLCMIVKDEEYNLERCLQCIAGYMNEIIIVDTGSKDRTREIALRYTNQVFDYQWVDDFAAARNFSISKANNEYVLVLDGDEFTESINMKELQRLMMSNPDKIGRLLRINVYTRGGVSYKYKERVNRLFSKKYYHYEGVIHEQLVRLSEVDSKSDLRDIGPDGETFLIPLTINHSGYQGDMAARKKKTARNIRLLNAALDKNPEDPYILYQIGKSFYMEEDYTNAVKYFGEALCIDLDPKLEYVQDMVESYGYSLINSEQYETAMQMLNIYEEFSHSADFIFLIALILMNNGEFNQAIKEFLKAVEMAECKMEGVNDYLAYYNVAVIYECLGDVKHAVEYYHKCGDYEPAGKRLSQMS